MNTYKRYGLLAAFSLVIFTLISLLQHQMYKSNISTHLQHETYLNKSLYHALVLKHEGDLFDIEHILKIGHEITGAEYFLFDLNAQDKLLNILSPTALDSIRKILQHEHDMSYPMEIGTVWHVLTFVRSENNPNLFIVTLNKSLVLQNIHDNRIKQFFILILVLSLLVALFNKTLLYAHNIKIEKDKISLALQESKLYFENAMIGFLIVDKDRNIINVNPLLCRLFGYEKDELVGKNVEIIHVSTESYQRWGQLIFAKAQKEDLVSIKYEMKKKDGTIFWVEVSGAPFDKKRELFDGGVVWTARDISTQVKNENIIKKLNAKLNEKLEYLRVILDVVPIPIFVKDVHNKYIECNKAFVAISGTSKDEILGKKVKDILSVDLAVKHAQQDLKLLSTDSIIYKEKYGIKNSVPIIYEIFKTVIKKETKNNGYICAMVDITKHEQQEGYLERKIQEEVAKNMEQAQAYEQEKLRDVKFSAIGQLSAGITHEINTPLTYVKGNLEMLKMDMQDIQDLVLKEQLIKDTTSLEDGLDRIAKIVDSMREMSQQTRETKEKVNVYATLVTALTLAYNRSKQISKIYLNGKEFTIKADKDEFYCICELQKQRIEQVWIVIINNALDELQKIDNFSEREFYIDCYKEEGFITIKFRDNAGGIAPQILNDIFEPFVSTKVHGGMGVGLSISKKILEEQDATIEAYNEDNGAVFEVKLLNNNI